MRFDWLTYVSILDIGADSQTMTAGAEKEFVCRL